MYITKVKLKDKGLSGAEIQYITKEERSTRFADVPITKSPPHPVHSDLEDMFKSLRFHLLEIFGIIHEDMDKGEKDSLMADTEVMEVHYEGGAITLIGQKLSLGDKSLKLKTHKIEEHDDYPNWGGLKVLVENIQYETKEYLNNTKKVNDKELLLKWTRAKKKDTLVNNENVDAFTPEQIQKMLDGIVNNKKLEMPKYEDYNEDLQIPVDQVIEITPPSLDPNPKRAKRTNEKMKVMESTPDGNMFVKTQEAEEDF